MKKAYVFPGQGAQFIGMGKDLYETNPQAKEVFDEASKTCDIFELLWDGVHPTTAGHQLIARQWKKIVFQK